MTTSNDTSVRRLTTDQIRILLVDDEENVLKSLRRLFLDEEYTIITATSGEEGLGILEEAPAQIVISDYRMPSMSGVDFLREVRNRWPETVRIVLSGYADTASIISAINEGQIYKFIPKPWNDEELKVTIANTIERYTLYKKNAELTLQLKTKNEELMRLNIELERLLEKETADLEFQNKVLTAHQNIIDLLPVGVIGVDGNDTVAMCNSSFSSITGGGRSPLGEDVRSVLPEEALRVIEEAKGGRRSSRILELGGVAGKIIGTPMEPDDGGKGVILIFVREKEAA